MSENGRILWEEKGVTIACEKGPEEVPGFVCEAIPTLAITMRAFGLFDVTHVESGLRICGPYERAGNAAEALVKVALCFDVTGSRRELILSVGELGDEPVPFEGATTTEAGETRPMTRKRWLGLERHNFPPDEFPWEDQSPWYRADLLLDEHFGEHVEPTP